MNHKRQRSINFAAHGSRVGRRGNVSLLHTGATCDEGRSDDLTDPSILDGPLWNHAPATALELIRRGAKMNIRHAAALGRFDLVKDLINEVEAKVIAAGAVIEPDWNQWIEQLRTRDVTEFSAP